jgi:hypothetical protein
MSERLLTFSRPGALGRQEAGELVAVEARVRVLVADVHDGAQDREDRAIEAVRSLEQAADAGADELLLVDSAVTVWSP